jgi:asparagine synthase (glutamine-hydrolysing)
MGASFRLPRAGIHRRQTASRDGLSVCGVVVAEAGTSEADLGARCCSRGEEDFLFADGSADPVAWAERWGRDPAGFLDGRDEDVGLRFDRGDGTLTLYTDRFGLRRIYTADLDDGLFLFGSEIKALLEHAPFGIDRETLARYLAFNYRMCLGRGQTFFAGIRELGAASVAEVSRSGASVRRYWQPPAGEVPSEGGDAELLGRFRSLFRATVERSLSRATNRLFLVSGGLDSPSVAVTASDLTREPVDCCAAVFPGHPELDEERYVAILTRGLARKTFLHPVVDREFLASYEQLLQRFDQPLFAPNFVINAQLMALAQDRGYDGVYGGGGGDRITSGNLEYQVYLLADYRRYGAERFGSEVEAWCRRVGPFLRTWPSRPEEVRAWVDRLVDPARPGRIFNLPDWTRGDASAYGPALRDLDPAAWGVDWTFDRYRQSRVAEDLFHQADPVQNTFEDIAAATTVPRVLDPFWDRSLFEFGFRLPVHLLLRDGWTKYALRKSMEDLLPPEICWRPDKTGLAVPLDAWLRSGVLAEAFRRVLRDDPWLHGGLFDVERVRSRFEEHATGKANHGTFLWKVFAACRWAHVWIKRDRA